MKDRRKLLRNKEVENTKQVCSRNGKTKKSLRIEEARDKVMANTKTLEKEADTKTPKGYNLLKAYI